MGLFGAKGDKSAAAGIADFFSGEDIDRIAGVMGKKVEGREYGKYNDIAAQLLEAVTNKEKTYDKKGLTALLYASGCMTKIEPSLKGILDAAIVRMRAFR